MEDEKLRDALIQQLWRMNKMDIVTHLREFIEGELATLWFLNVSGDTTIIPSMISDNSAYQPRAHRHHFAHIARKGLCDDGYFRGRPP